MRAEPAGGAARVLAALALFGVAFGFVEAAVVADLRAVYEPIHRRLHPDAAPDALFPILTLDQLRSAGEVPTRLLGIELAREAATLAMLAAVALAVARRPATWLAAFVLAFGVWDLAFYGSLKLLLDWPGSWRGWDLLFLLPVPWSGPVVAPMGVAAAMVACGAASLVREASGRPMRHASGDWAAVGLGGMVLVVAFCWDWRNVAAGGMPGPFRWDLYGVGLALGLAGFARGALRRPPIESREAPP